MNMLDKLVFFPGKPFQPSPMQQLNLLGMFVSYEENEVLWIQSQEPCSTNLIFFITYE